MRRPSGGIDEFAGLSVCCMNNRSIPAMHLWPRTESWWKASDRCIPSPRLKWSRPLIQRLRELRQRGDDVGWRPVKW